MSVFVIEKGIPIPPVERAGRQRSYPFLEMQIGDSFLAKGVPIHTMTAAASKHAIRYGSKFTCRTQTGGVRVWRIE